VSEPRNDPLGTDGPQAGRMPVPRTPTDPAPPAEPYPSTQDEPAPWPDPAGSGGAAGSPSGPVGVGEPGTEPLGAPGRGDDPPNDGPPPGGQAARTDPDPDGEASTLPARLPSVPFKPRRGKGFADPALLAGRPVRIYVYIFVLILAAAADLANFYQIIQFALRDQGDLLFLSADALLAITVVGFTACVLFLAHITGVMFRDRRARETWIPAVLPWLTLLVWAGLGGAGLYLRLTADTGTGAQDPLVITGQPAAVDPSPAPGVDPSPSTAVDPTPSPAAEPSPAVAVSPGRPVTTPAAATVFLGLYLGAGLVALVGGYLTHNPAHAALRRARREEQRAVDDAADAARAYELARGEVERLELLRRNAELRTFTDWVELRHLGEVLKWEARLRASQHKQSPDFTDAWVPPPERLDRADRPDSTDPS